MWEHEGIPLGKVAEAIGVNRGTVQKWKSREQWMRPAEGNQVEQVEAVAEVHYDDGTTVTDEPPTFDAEGNGGGYYGDEAELRARVAELEAELEEKSKQVDKYKPTRALGDMFNDRVKWLTDHSPEGEKYWINRAEAEFKKENMDRAKQGLPTFDIKQHPELLDDLIVQLKTKEAMARDKVADEPPTRRIKMFIERNGMPTIEQIPFEQQINNTKGSLADGVVRYTRKGFKLTDPFLCPRAGCFKPAGVDEFQRWLHDGYCSETHRQEVEGDKRGQSMVGLQTQESMLSGYQ